MFKENYMEIEEDIEGNYESINIEEL